MYVKIPEIVYIKIIDGSWNGTTLTVRILPYYRRVTGSKVQDVVPVLSSSQLHETMRIIAIEPTS
jgi:hypothetical protein